MKKFFKKSKVLTPPPATEEIGRGFVSPGEPVSIYDDGEDFFIPDVHIDQNIRVDNINEVIDLLLQLGDNEDMVDDDDSKSLASFADFLIKKVAEHKHMDYTKLFNNLLEKISDSDMIDSNMLIIKLSKMYSRSVMLDSTAGEGMDEAKRLAYIKTMKHAERYIGNLR